jgi:polyketide synthase 12/epothilone polyketide synthase D
MLDAFEQVAASISYQRPQLPVVSNVTGAVAQGDELMTPKYWRAHAREAVQFTRGMSALAAHGARIFIEVGPQPTLIGLGRQTVDAADALWAPSLRSGRSAWLQLLESLGSLYAAGVAVDWAGFDRDYRRRKVALPVYPFQRQRYWVDSRDPSDRSDAHESAPSADALLGRSLNTALADRVFEARFDRTTLPFLAEHRLLDRVVCPGTAYASMAFAAACRIWPDGSPSVEDVVITQPLVVPDAGRIVQTIVSLSESGDEAAVRVLSRAVDDTENGWLSHATATIRASAPSSAQPESLDAVRRRVVTEVAVEPLYEDLRAAGLDLGPAFQGIERLWRNGAVEALAHIQVTAFDGGEGVAVHPATLDSCFQALGGALRDAAPQGEAASYVPLGIARVRLDRSPSGRMWSHVRLLPTGGSRALTADLTLYDDDGAFIGAVDGLQLARAERSAAADAPRSAGDDLYEVLWKTGSLPVERITIEPGAFAIFADGHGLGESLQHQLAQAGSSAVVVRRGKSYRRVSDAVEIDPLNPSDIERLFDELSAGGNQPLRGIVHLWNLDGPAGAEVDPTAFQVDGCASVLHLAQTLVRRDVMSSPLWVVTRGAQPAAAANGAVAQAPVWGLCRGVTAEHPELPCVCVDLDPAGKLDDAASLWREMQVRSRDNQIALRADARYVPRLTKRSGIPSGTASAATAAVRLDITERGMLDNLALKPAARRAPGPREIEIEVSASGLNFRDVLNALGMYPGDPGPIGNECTGTIVAVGSEVVDLKVGEKVVALGGGTFGTFVTTPAAFAAPAPSSLDAEDAATIPIAFLTTEYALVNLGRIKAGDRVLIHAAAGGVGLAAVQLALAAGCEIFATASESKRDLLRSLGVQHVMDSRSLTFADQIREATGGVGVDVVLNSLSGDFVAATVSALAKNARFLELGKIGIWSPEEMRERRPDVDYHIVDFSTVPHEVTTAVLRTVVAKFTDGTLKPLPRKVFPLADAIEAFRFMAQAKHVGKIVLSIGGQRADAVTCQGDRTYLVTGGYGALGLHVARWMIERGARHVALVGRRGPAVPAAQAIEDLRRQADVRVFSADIAEAGDADRLFKELAAAMPPLAGIVHAAGTLDDGAVLQQRWERFGPVFAPKVAGAWNLDRLTRTLPLDFFVLFSSMTSLLGNRGQANYAAANAFLDALAHDRRSRGLPAVTINWGPWAESGMAASVESGKVSAWESLGVGLLTESRGMALLEQAIVSGEAQLAAIPIDWRTFMRSFAAGAEPPLLSEFAITRGPARRKTAPADRPGAAALQKALDEARPADRARVVQEYVTQQARAVLGLDASFTFQPHQGLRDVGLDSLMAVELRNRLQRGSGLSLPATLAFDFPTIEALTSRLLEKLGGAEAPAARDAGARTVAAANASGAPEAIAIVGLGCRFPGGASSPDAFWERLARGFDATAEIPGDRWNIDAYYDPDPDAPGKMYTRRGAFLDRVDLFDPQFFGISPREAVSLDPQQRLLLEVTWEALEHAGKAPDRLFGSKTGVFVGISTNEYGWLQRDAIGTPDVYAGTGNAISAAAGRLSYVLGLQGPSLSVDTACSSSLVAIHLACQSLRARECSLALAGGVNVMLVPDVTVNFCRARMMSADGHCKTFDASADGYVRGEGCGMIVLKRLSDAIAAGDTILAVIAGSGSNQDGRSSGLTVPNGPAQEELLRDVYATAGILPADVDYVEAHGTGTSLGDPIEVQALGSVFGRDRRADKPLLLGSVKTNIGHLEAAAGVSGLIKVVLSLQHQQIPPHLHFSVPNPNIPWTELPVEVTTSGRAWPADGGRRVAGVSSFGFTGTNAHVVLTSAPVPAIAAPASERPRHVLALSAKSAEALNELATVYTSEFDASGASVPDICFTASAGRSHFEYRLAVCGESAADFRDGLRAFADGRIPSDARAGRAVGLAPKIAFEFADTISGGCRELYDTQPVFRQALDEYAVASRAAGIAEWLETLLAGAGEIASPSQAAARVALAGALSALWRSWGIEPAAVTGDATACAVAAGTLTIAGAMASIVSPDSRQPARPSGDREGVLVASNRQELAAGGFTVVPVGAAQAAWKPLLQQLAELYVAGAPIDWNAFDSAYARHIVHVPTYPFQRQRYWLNLAADSRLFKGAAGQAAAVPVDSLQYEIRWDKQAAPTEDATASTGIRGTWLLLADAGGTGASVAAELRRRGDRCIVLLPPGKRAATKDEWLLNGDGVDAFEAVIRRAVDGGALKGVVHLSNLDATAVTATSVASLAADQASGCTSVLNLTQALVRSGAGARLWIVTSGAEAVETGVTEVSQAPAWGMGRVIALEHPDVWGGLIDVDRSAAGHAAAHIVESLTGTGAEDQVVYRNGARYVPRLVPSTAGTGRRLDATGGTYLITGGLGSLGLKTAEWLAERGASAVVLLGRQPLPPRDQWASFGADHPARARIDTIRRIEHHGARVQTFAADVCDAERMRVVFEDVRRMDPPLKGIVHAAGVSNPRPITALDAAALEQELSAKTRGSWILHELSRDLPIDFFVCYSSIAAVWGSTGLAHYAAANHFLDALAHHRRAIGLPALSINWGRLWLGGMVSADSAQWLEATGVGALSEEDAAAAFERLVVSDLPQATVARMDWTTFKPLYEARGPRPFLSLVGVETAVSATATAPGRLADELRSAAAPSRAAIVVPAMAGWIAGILGLPPDAVSGDVSLSKLGFDSLMALELRNRIQTEVGVTVPLVTIVEGPAVSELATMVADRFGEAAGGQEAAPPPAREQHAESVDDLSDESVDELLRQLLSDKAQ